MRDSKTMEKVKEGVTDSQREVVRARGQSQYSDLDRRVQTIL
jgi:hypothetical protein